jgi:hypothetical protein
VGSRMDDDRAGTSPPCLPCSTSPYWRSLPVRNWTRSATGNAIEHPTWEPVGVNLSSLPRSYRCTRAVRVESDNRPDSNRVTTARAVAIGNVP